MFLASVLVICAILPTAVGLDCFQCRPNMTSVPPTFCDMESQYTIETCTANVSLCGKTTVMGMLPGIPGLTTGYLLACTEPNQNCTTYNRTTCNQSIERAMRTNATLFSCTSECCNQSNCNIQILPTTPAVGLDCYHCRLNLTSVPPILCDMQNQYGIESCTANVSHCARTTVKGIVPGIPGSITVYLLGCTEINQDCATFDSTICNQSREGAMKINGTLTSCTSECCNQPYCNNQILPTTPAVGLTCAYCIPDLSVVPPKLCDIESQYSNVSCPGSDTQCSKTTAALTIPGFSFTVYLLGCTTVDQDCAAVNTTFCGQASLSASSCTTECCDHEDNCNKPTTSAVGLTCSYCTPDPSLLPPRLCDMESQYSNVSCPGNDTHCSKTTVVVTAPGVAVTIYALGCTRVNQDCTALNTTICSSAMDAFKSSNTSISSCVTECCNDQATCNKPPTPAAQLTCSYCTPDPTSVPPILCDMESQYTVQSCPGHNSHCTKTSLEGSVPGIPGLVTVYVLGCTNVDCEAYNTTICEEYIARAMTINATVSSCVTECCNDEANCNKPATSAGELTCSSCTPNSTNLCDMESQYTVKSCPGNNSHCFRISAEGSIPGIPGSLTVHVLDCTNLDCELLTTTACELIRDADSNGTIISSCEAQCCNDEANCNRPATPAAELTCSFCTPDPTSVPPKLCDMENQYTMKSCPGNNTHCTKSTIMGSVPAIPVPITIYVLDCTEMDCEVYNTTVCQASEAIAAASNGTISSCETKCCNDEVNCNNPFLPTQQPTTEATTVESTRVTPTTAELTCSSCTPNSTNLCDMESQYTVKSCPGNNAHCFRISAEGSIPGIPGSFTVHALDCTNLDCELLTTTACELIRDAESNGTIISSCETQCCNDEANCNRPATPAAELTCSFCTPDPTSVPPKLCDMENQYTMKSCPGNNTHCTKSTIMGSVPAIPVPITIYVLDCTEMDCEVYNTTVCQASEAIAAASNGTISSCETKCCNDEVNCNNPFLPTQQPTMEATTVESTRVTPTTKDGPEFSTHPQNVTTKEGFNLTLSCNATGNPTPTIIWTKDHDGSHINADADSRIRISEDGTQLTITTVTREDDGQYQCVAHNSYGNSTSHTAALSVQYRPEFSIHPQNVTEKEGYNVSLSCHATGNPTPTIIWTKDGSHINADADSRIRISKDGTQLTITTVTREDDGQYQCVAHNGCGNSSSDLATLTVQYRPEFSTDPQNVTDKEGYNVSLSCYATGNPTPTIIWTKGGSHINADADSRIRISKDGTQLSITTVSREDDGRYQCVAHNGCGNSSSDPATLTVQYRPEFSIHPQNVTEKEGYNVSLSCYATGNPTPTIIWTKGGSHINADADSRVRISEDGTQLSITTVSREDDGQYQCVAHNGCGNSSSDPATLTVQSNCHLDILYPFGPEQKDNELQLNDSLYHSYHYCSKIFTDRAGFLFSDKRHYKLHICRNGIIQLDFEWMWWWPYKFGVYRWLREHPIIAPFWAPIDDFWAFETGHSKVFYQVYSRQINGVSQGTVDADILTMASQHVREYQKDETFAAFEATWVLVVTWQNLSPYSWYGYDFYLNYKSRVCPSGLFNTFQAVIITNGFNTFLIYNYPYGYIKWVAPTLPSHITYWTSVNGLPVAGWNAGDGIKESYENIDRSGTVEMLAIDKTVGNTGLNGRYFWRIENGEGNAALVKCFSWGDQQTNSSFLSLYNGIRSNRRISRRMACPCSLRQALIDRRFRIDWSTWPNVCAYSRRRIYLYLPIYNRQLQIQSYETVYLSQQCCYSTEFDTWGALKQGSPDGSRILVNFLGHVNNSQVEFYNDSAAYKLCCVDSPLCDFFYYFRPSDNCSHYRPPRRRWFWGDPHIKTLDGKNYTFNGLGEYVMLDGQDGLFQLQARTRLAQGNSTTGTIFSAGAAKEENTSTIEVRVKDGGGLHILINGSVYDDFASLTNQSVEISGSIYLSKPEENCVESSFPSTTSIKFCEAKGMLSFVVTPSDDFNNATKGLLGTWNDDPDDDFTLPDGTVLPASSTLEQIHFEFGVKWQINASQSLFTYDEAENVSTFSDPSFQPMFADNITWANDSLRMAAEEQCGEDYECLFDVASTNDLSVGAVTKNINIQLVNETNQLENFPPRIVHAPSVINAAFGEVVEVNITAEDNDTITFQVINKPAGATVNTTEDTLFFTWPVNSTQKFNLSFVVTDEKGAKTNWRPTINMCACLHGGQCVPPEQGDELNTDSKFVYLGCACQGGYTGRFCDSDIDACESNGQPCYEGVECIDLPPPANTSGYKCGPCPSGYTGDGAQCADFNECQDKANNNCEQVCVNIPASFVCECNNGYQLNADGHSCVDIDECYPSSDCWQQCVNTVGSYNCSCDQYFTKDPSDWKRCLPEKSCSADHGCSQVCFEGENNEPLCKCNRGYQLESDGKTCKDIDECDPDKPRHRCNQICKNTPPGSYMCECLDGFELNRDGFECEDINECLDIASFNCTDEFHRCVNTRGSYKCECEPGLYWIDGKCRGLEKNETAPTPVVPKPREPSQKEKDEAVELSFPSSLHWKFTKDKDFKEKMASLATSYCSDNRTKCGLKERRLKRRSLGLDSYTADQVHLLPGYPKNTSGFLLVVFYMQQPLGIIADLDAIPASTLVEIVNTHKSEIEEAVGANILNVQALLGPTTASTTKPTGETKKQSSDDWKWIAIGVSVGVVVIIVVIIVLVFWCKNKERVRPEWKVPKEPKDHMNMVYYNTYNLEQGSGSLPDVQSSL